MLLLKLVKLLLLKEMLYKNLDYNLLYNHLHHLLHHHHHHRHLHLLRLNNLLNLNLLEYQHLKLKNYHLL